MKRKRSDESELSEEESQKKEIAQLRDERNRPLDFKFSEPAVTISGPWPYVLVKYTDRSPGFLFVYLDLVNMKAKEADYHGIPLYGHKTCGAIIHPSFRWCGYELAFECGEFSSTFDVSFPVVEQLVPLPTVLVAMVMSYYNETFEQFIQYVNSAMNKGDFPNDLCSFCKMRKMLEIQNS